MVEVVEFKKWSNRMAKLRLEHKKKSWRIVTVYSQNTKEMQTITEGIEEREEGFLILGGHFNARVGEEGDPFKEMMTEEKEEKRSKDKNVNRGKDTNRGTERQRSVHSQWMFWARGRVDI